MDREETADAVAGAVRVIDAVGPEELPRQRIELATRRPGGEARAIDGDMPFEHLGEAAPVFGGRLADGNRARNVGRAVGILPARIDEIEHAGGDLAVARLVDAIMA